MTVLVAIECGGDAPVQLGGESPRALVAALTIPCSALASGQIGAGQSVATLATAELTGTNDVWTNYVELAPATHIVCNYNLPAGVGANTVAALALDVNYRGPTAGWQLWTFQVLDTVTGSWVSLGDNTFATGWVWTKQTLTFPAPASRFFSASGLLQIRYGTDSSADASTLDQMLVRGTSDSGMTGSGGAGGLSGRGGTNGAGGQPGRGGTTGAGGLKGRGGTTAAGGVTAAGGTTGAGGRSFSVACSSLASGAIGGGQSVSSLAAAELTGKGDDWASYVEVEPASQIVCNYTLPPDVTANAVTSLALQVNYRGPSKARQLWTFEVRDATTGAWVSLGDNAFGGGWVWTPYTFAFAGPLARYFSGSTLQIRYGSASNVDASNLDQMLVTATSGAPSGGGPPSGGGNGSTGVCGATSAPPARYQHVVVFSFENRVWSDTGLGFSGPAMPYLRALAAQCSYFSDWVETNTAQSSLTQYIGTTSGLDNPSTVDDCDPSPDCRSTDDNIFRQVRAAGGTARSYVEGATAPCAADGNNAPRHVPALYYYGTYTDATGTHNDHDFCGTEVRPYAEFDVGNLPTFAWITPDLCNDGHDCPDSVVDSWAATHVQRVLDSAAYKAGTVAVFIWYDEDYPVPNATIAPTSHRGNITQPGIGSHPALLKTVEDMLGLPVLNQGQVPAAANLRSILGL
jgi:cysteinyl-tRNA synthetase